MANDAQALATMIAKIEKQTGQSLAELGTALQQSGLAKHSELRQFLIDTYGLGYGQANTVVHLAKRGDGSGTDATTQGGNVLDDIYAGKKAALRPIHDALLTRLAALGPFEAAPKKDYISYRRQKQFVMIGPKTATAVEIGFGAKALPADARLKPMPPNSMCRFTTRISSVAEIDAALEGWIRTAYTEAG